MYKGEQTSKSEPLGKNKRYPLTIFIKLSLNDKILYKRQPKKRKEEKNVNLEIAFNSY